MSEEINIREVRLNVRPTSHEIANRSARDKLKPGLLQHEMAERLKCSTSTIRKIESENRLPRNKAISHNFQEMLKEITG